MMSKHDPRLTSEVNILLARAVTLVIGSVDRPLLVSDGPIANQEDRICSQAPVDEVW